MKNTQAGKNIQTGEIVKLPLKNKKKVNIFIEGKVGKGKNIK
ncbi:hypothetical protein [Staphylococcus aureus]|nr:hypothetical protein [Staphylococcus aureus]